MLLIYFDSVSKSQITLFLKCLPLAGKNVNALQNVSLFRQAERIIQKNNNETKKNLSCVLKKLFWLSGYDCCLPSVKIRSNRQTDKLLDILLLLYKDYP